MITEQELFTFISEFLEVDSNTLALDTTLESLNVDSLRKMELVFDAEDRFNIKVSDSDSNPSTLQDVLNLINK